MHQACLEIRREMQAQKREPFQAPSFYIHRMVLERGLEPPRVSPLDP